MPKKHAKQTKEPFHFNRAYGVDPYGIFGDKKIHVHKKLTGHGLETEKQCARAFKRQPVTMCCDRPSWPWADSGNENNIAVNFKLNFKL